MFLQQISCAFQRCKNFENWLRFDKVTESLKVGTFLRHIVHSTRLSQLRNRPTQATSPSDAQYVKINLFVYCKNVFHNAVSLHDSGIYKRVMPQLHVKFKKNSKLLQLSLTSVRNNFISCVETCVKLFRNYFRGLLQLMNIFQHCQCR